MACPVRYKMVELLATGSNEVLFLKSYDSMEDGRARFTAHTGFDNPTSPADAPARESIEARTFVFLRLKKAH